MKLNTSQYFYTKPVMATITKKKKGFKHKRSMRHKQDKCAKDSFDQLNQYTEKQE